MLDVFSKTNNFTVDANSKCGKRDVRAYSFTCYQILLNCAGSVSSLFTCDEFVLACMGAWVASLKSYVDRVDHVGL